MSNTFDKDNLQAGIVLTNRALEMLKHSTGDTQSFLNGVKHAIAALYSIPRAFGMDEPPLYTVDLALGDGGVVQPENLQINKTYILKENTSEYDVEKPLQYVIYIGKDCRGKYKFISINKAGGVTNPETLPTNKNIFIDTNPRFSNRMRNVESSTTPFSYSLTDSKYMLFSIKQADRAVSGSLRYSGKGGRRQRSQKRSKRRFSTTHKRKRI